MNNKILIKFGFLFAGLVLFFLGHEYHRAGAVLTLIGALVPSPSVLVLTARGLLILVVSSIVVISGFAFSMVSIFGANGNVFSYTGLFAIWFFTVINILKK